MRTLYRIMTVLLIAAVFAVPAGVYAVSTAGSVVYDGGTLSAEPAAVLSEFALLQPGDSVKYTVSVANESSGDTEWYLEDTVLQSLEENRTASDGAYAYTLTYVSPQGKNEVVYDGTQQEEIDLYLDTLKAGEQAKVLLTVAMSKESPEVTYLGSDAELIVAFAVEPVEKPDASAVSASVITPNTGDETKIMPYVILFSVSFAAVVVLLIRKLVSERKKNDKK